MSRDELLGSRRLFAACMLSADATTVEALVLGGAVPRSRLQEGVLTAIGESLLGPDVVLDDDLALRVELLPRKGDPAGVDVLRFMPAAEFAAETELSSEPLAADTENGAVIPAGGLVVIFGAGGSGKTTLCLDLLVHLATGRTWLDLVTPARELRIGLVENEGPRAMFREKLARKLAHWPDAGERIFVLDEPWQGVTFRDERQRAELARHVVDRKLDLLVAAPVARLGMQGGGTLDEVGEFAALVADVQRRVGSLAVLLVHHENRAGQVSGAWEGVPDTLLHVQAQGHGRTRVFFQKLRWSSALHGTTSQLLWAPGETFTVEPREEITEESIADGILAAAREMPGGSWRKIRERVRGNVTDAAAVRDRLLDDGLLVNGAAQEGRFNLWASDDPAAPGSELRTALEPLSSASPDGDGVADRFPVPGSSRNREPEPPHGTGAAGAQNGRPLLGDDGYQERALAALADGLITERELKQALAAHALVADHLSGDV